MCNNLKQFSRRKSLKICIKKKKNGWRNGEKVNAVEKRRFERRSKAKKFVWNRNQSRVGKFIISNIFHQKKITIPKRYLLSFIFCKNYNKVLLWFELHTFTNLDNLTHLCVIVVMWFQCFYFFQKYVVMGSSLKILKNIFIFEIIL